MALACAWMTWIEHRFVRGARWAGPLNIESSKSLDYRSDINTAQRHIVTWRGQRSFGTTCGCTVILTGRAAAETSESRSNMHALTSNFGSWSKIWIRASHSLRGGGYVPLKGGEGGLLIYRAGQGMCHPNLQFHMQAFALVGRSDSVLYRVIMAARSKSYQFELETRWNRLSHVTTKHVWIHTIIQNSNAVLIIYRLDVFEFKEVVYQNYIFYLLFFAVLVCNMFSPLYAVDYHTKRAAYLYGLLYPCIGVTNFKGSG